MIHYLYINLKARYMNLNLITATLLSVVAVTVLLNSQFDLSLPQTKTLYEAWKIEFNKSYKSEAENNYRLRIFSQSLGEIDQLKSKVTYEIGLTKFSDLTIEEFMAKYTGNLDSVNLDATNQIIDSEITQNLKESVDFRSCLPPMKNQGRCGSCWAFGTVAMTEFALNCPVGGKVSPVVHSLSEQELVDCDTEHDKGCVGGHSSYALTYIRTSGLNPTSAYPYYGQDRKCTRKQSMDTLHPKSSFKGPFIEYYARIQPGNGLAVESASQQRVLGISVDASPMVMYKSGIIEGDSCQMVRGWNHAVAIVGQGVEEGNKYYLVRNSWGSGWGMEGYFKVIREPEVSGYGCIGLRAFAYYPIIQF